ncbi:ArsO family NAD(P)H-dependent flavin-containing monooxygenase [Amycolatopsis sp. EV170708-02-1]|uniref:ArsO family NAD(P)H-dependent flavin-containing monooxygenase n=1 Tax=Amycolatopsis sp. EV170708-02-1 TaxID=2919322 RepID=UPI001F0C71FD|nr:ArsO family NAD(P)H-dependent flavin-containing monooxygenase [Amycolatopsis sp. EV170708-02-1]UMP07299.1 ArsO family NAD(P)H-dependent flavin-containing monooxygenase [Amycolatopsis sp. EV170708-02-1]
MAAETLASEGLGGVTGTARVVVVGGGQAGLAAGYHLRRAGLDFVILDAQAEPGGAWTHGWDSLRLFSPARHSSLPGWPMPPYQGPGYPTAGHVVDYLAAYEKRYELPILRSETVTAVSRAGTGLRVSTDTGTWAAEAVISATGTWWRPFLPLMPGGFTGRRLHTVDYRSPKEFAGQDVVVVGGGNSGAQIAADLVGVANLTWVTRRPPRYLPDDIDGKALFDVATRRRQAIETGRPDTAGVAGLGDIVAVPPVRETRDAGLLDPRPMFARLDSDGPAWTDGSGCRADAIIWCTGFRPALGHLAPLRLRTTHGRIPTAGTRVVAEPRLHLLGYGDWTGPASATLIGVGMTARAAVADIKATLDIGG